MKKLTAVSAAVLMGLALTACSADRHDRGPRTEQGMKKDFKRGGMPRDLAELNLTDAQKAQIKQIMEQNRPQARQQGQRPAPDDAQREQFRNQMQVQHAAEQQLILAPAFDEAAAKQLIAQENQQQAAHLQQREATHDAFELQQLKTRHAVMQVLTPEQRQQWLANQQKRQDARKGDRRGPAQGQPAPQR